jgi:alpha-beta hydrolase superfamily lysophospholipase
MKVKSIASISQTKSNIMSLQSVTATEVFTQEELATITACWDESKPQGKFLKDRHGFTHYRLDGSGQGPMVVLCHGLGTSMEAFEKISEDLVNSGYSVLKYDYYGHGYSKYGGKHLFFAYNSDMFVDQLDDLLDHIEKEEGAKPAAICGHSTGGIVCVAANDRWSKEGSKRGIVPKLILISPAFYAKKVSCPRFAQLKLVSPFGKKVMSILLFLTISTPAICSQNR